ncbi:hypothetical protein ADL27_56900 [Streptomyces sp. NRRL F-6602]|nr:hypothetical protein ADL27_56900 [Streptomyces sp. NRRL F-6602]
MDAANAGFGTLAFAAVGTVVMVAGFKYRWLRDKKTVALVAVGVLLVTINSAGLLGEVAGAIRGGLNSVGEAAVTQVTGTSKATGAPSTTVARVSAGGAVVGLCIIAWFVVKLVAAKGKARDMREMVVGAVCGICYGTGLGFTGYFVAPTVLTANNVGLWLIGG